MTASHATTPSDSSHAWSAVGAMTMCVALLIASEFMPVSLLTPIAHDLHATDGMAGQAISISGLFAVVTSLFIATVSSRFDRRHVLMALTAAMLASLALIAEAPNFGVLMVARALLGITIGGFWSLSTATLMRLVPERALSRAVGILYMGNAAATAFAAPIGSYLGGVIGWRGVFWLLLPLAAINLAWQWISLPAMPSPAAIPVQRVLALLRRRQVALAMVGILLTFGGALGTFTYLRPFLETHLHASVAQLSLLLLGLGLAGFAGTHLATAWLEHHLYRLLQLLPLALGAITLALLAVGPNLWVVALLLVVWGGLNSAIPVAWVNWLAQAIKDEPEVGGGLMVAVIQLAIMLGAAGGGFLLDHVSIAATFAGGAICLIVASVVIGGGARLRPTGAEWSAAAC